MKILISCLSFSQFTGSEMYVYELARELSKEHDVDIVSPNVGQGIGGDLVERIKPYGINVFDFKSPPNYFLGDGKTQYTVDGVTKTTINNKFYKISNETKYDLMILNHAGFSSMLLDLYPTKALNIVHSEILPKYEYPIIHPNVLGYISVRPAITKWLKEDWNIPQEKIKWLLNPIDDKRFNQEGVVDGDYILFVGSYDYLRKETVNYLIDDSKKKNLKLKLVGRGYPKFEQDWVETHEPTWDVETHTKSCAYVASIMYGRTVFEGNMCGKSAQVFNVDQTGKIQDISYIPPTPCLENRPSHLVREVLKFFTELIEK